MNLREKISPPWLTDPAAQAVFSTLERGGFTGRAVGGIVRNTLLGLPATDIDIATDAPPELTMSLARASGFKTIPTGLAHGTITVFAHGTPFEVTTLRRDVSTDGRHAKVAFTDDWAADAARRDFTINALYCDRHGTIFDPLGGAADLYPPRIRFIGDPFVRITEDYLRILRFFRFSAVFCADGVLDQAGLAAVTALSHGLAQISGERVQTEVFKLLAAPYAVPATREWVRCGVFGALFNLAANLEAFNRMAALETILGRSSDPVLRLAALAITDPSDAQTLAKRLKLSTRDRKILIAAAQSSALISSHLPVAAAKTLLYRLGASTYINMVLLVWAKGQADLTDEAFTALATLPQRWPIPAFPLTGADAVAAGAPPGPAMGRLLADFERLWIESEFELSRSELLADLKRRISADGFLHKKQ